ncbi:hypothetical protein A3860_06395 [Niastella vici]|uniref:Uncharacterized protein n=1 Tax=Niastella vici TaxID=1703345 RepID=A0A1V9FSY2_9BACT|nr:hypothetical protein [Niastella vici]OQP61336.1 hypothetical protein A3860_06395 [Niastella vici]
MSEKNTHQLVVNLEGLKLSEDHLQRINQSIQKAVMTELAGIDLNGTQGGLLAGFDPRTRGIWYIKDLQKIVG